LPFDVICVGDANVDLITQLSSMPDFETETKPSGFVLSPGGNACNSSFAFARAGLKTALVSRIGDDLFGTFLLKEFKKFKIDPSFIEKTSLEKTGFSQIFDVEGKKAIVSDKGASRHLTLKNLPKKYVLSSKVLYLGGYFHLPAFQKEFPKFLQRITKLKKTPFVCFDTCFDENNKWMDALEPLLPHIDLLFTNSNELQYLTEEREFRAGAKALVSAGAKTVIVKLGKQGSACFRQNSEFYEKAPAVTEIDGTSTGDAFNAGFTAGTLNNLSTKQCLALGNFMGSRVATGLGSINGLPSKKEITGFIKKDY